MKKILIFSFILFALGISSFVYSATILSFKDSEKIPEWAKEGVDYFSDPAVGVLQGYENGNFGPEDYVTRAQLAAILKRYEKYEFENIRKNMVESQLISTLFSNISYFNKTNLPDEVKWALAFAQAGMREITDPSWPEPHISGSIKGFIDSPDVKKITSDEIPKGFEVYFWDYDLLYGGGYYVHHFYEGVVPGSGRVEKFDIWYGPYSAGYYLLTDGTQLTSWPKE